MEKSTAGSFPEVETGPEESQFIIGESPLIKKAIKLAETVALSDATVLIRGETGTGKELIARLIHQKSLRKNNRFVTINCGALAESLLESELFGHEKGSFTGATSQKIGKFEYANGGTVFLDEIGEVSMNMQARLLKILESREFERIGGNRAIRADVRIVSATNRNLREMVKEGKFREDLFYRLNVFPIHLPPLRDRKEDVPLLAGHFIKEYAAKNRKNVGRIAPKALAKMMGRSWPGNIRELENVVERSVILSSGRVLEEIFIDDEEGQIVDVKPEMDGSEPDMDSDLTFKQMQQDILEKYGKKYFTSLLEKTGGRINRATEIAGIDRKTLYRKLMEYGVRKEDFRKGAKDV